MDLFPAIDLRDGRSVRLVQGDFARERIFGDPVASAVAMAAAGARYLHVVDLDAARTGDPVNRSVVADIATSVAAQGVFVQAGGGVRDEAAAEALLSVGVARVVLGTAAVERPGLVRRLARRFPGRIAVALDYRREGGCDTSRPRPAGATGVSLTNAKVAVRGWTSVSGESLLGVLSCFEDAGAAAVMVTDVGRDGTLAGPDFAGLVAVLDATGMEVVASGGVSSLADLVTLSHLGRPERRLSGAIVGMALREDRFTIPEAMEACAASG
ncbi:MAG: HisA/HisF-related TIM barrel protein [Acidimicrobiales bacterium]